MLAWLTFAAAAVAAVGAVLGPIIASRTSAARRQQEDVDRYVEFAVSADTSVRGLGITHLDYLLKSGRLTPVQANAAAAAVTAAVAKADERVQGHPGAAVAQVSDSRLDQDGVDRPWDDEEDEGDS